MKHPVEQVGWLVVWLLLGGLIAYSTSELSADPIVSEQTTTTKDMIGLLSKKVESKADK